MSLNEDYMQDSKQNERQEELEKISKQYEEELAQTDGSQHDIVAMKYFKQLQKLGFLKVAVATPTFLRNDLFCIIDKIISMKNEEDFTENNSLYLEKLKKTDELLNKQPELINSREAFNVTPMHCAAGAGLFELVKVLLKHNPDLTAENEFGQTPSQRALKYARRADIAKYIDDYQQNTKDSSYSC